MRFLKQTGLGINKFGMIKNGDSVLLGISGGKDSLSLALALSLRRKWLPISYTLRAAIVEWKQFPIKPADKNAISCFLAELDIDHDFLVRDMFPASFRGKFNCYLCSRTRKRILFEEADRLDIKKIALGHHLDDIAETTLINLCLRGNFSTMMPVQSFFKGKVFIVRPLCMVRESTVSLVASRLSLPCYALACPHHETNLRLRIKPYIKELSRIDPRVREHIFAAHWNINGEYSDYANIAHEILE